jgi:hypothetical protein
MTKKARQHQQALLRCQTPAEVAQLLGMDARDKETEVAIAS